MMNGTASVRILYLPKQKLFAVLGWSCITARRQTATTAQQQAMLECRHFHLCILCAVNSTRRGELFLPFLLYSQFFFLLFSLQCARA